MCNTLTKLFAYIAIVIVYAPPPHAAANVLFQISKECRCKSILHCTCGDKYTIKISDFDRAIQSKHIREPKHFSVCKTSMKGDKMVDVEGTKGYRAPEVSQC